MPHHRAVRGEQCGEIGDFIDNDDGTITDNKTGLMWQKDTPQELYTWQGALSYCESSTLAAYNDWRLPSRNELQSIVDYSRYDPSIDPIFNAVLSDYWSSTTFANSPDQAWVVKFGYGVVSFYSKSNNYYVRAVRGGQCESPDTSTTTTISGSTTTTVQSCPTEEIYGEYSLQTELLRNFRDNVLTQTSEGQEIIRLYYELSPVIVEMMERDESFKQEVKQVVDEILEVIKEAE